MLLNTRRMMATLALLLSVTSLSWLSWSAQAARAGRPLLGRSSRTVSSAAPTALATTIMVNSTADGTLAVLAANATCDLREAVAAANTNAVVGQCPAGMAGADTITFAPTVSGTIGLTVGELVLSEAVIITGPGADMLAVSGNNASRVFFVNTGVTASISGLTITGGNGVGAVNSSSGGGIRNQGNLIITASHITGNTAGLGGGTSNSGSLTIERSAITNNTANGSPFVGGGIENFATLIVSNSTVSGNRVVGTGGRNGGGIVVSGTSGTTTITASTITDNESAGPFSASGVLASRTVTVRNTIIAANRNNTTTPDVVISGIGTFASQGYNLIGNPGNATTFTATGDQVGTMATPLNPVLGPLTNNGGPTPTHLLLVGSPAIDKGNSFGLMVDQRSSPRPVDMPTIANAVGGDGADIGAYELLGPAVPGTAVGPGVIFPAAAEVSDQKAGSVLVYNLYSSSAGALNAQNTRISITNTNPTRDIAVHLFFVDGQTCSIADAIICLTKNQTATFLASDIDPGTTGYLVAVASDLSTGCPRNFNFLIGDAYVKLASGHQANLGAEAFAAFASGPIACDGNAVTAQLNFDGVSYNRAPRTLAASSIPARGDGNDTLLILNRFGGNLATGASTLTDLLGLFYDDAENALSFTFAPGTCQFRSSLSSNFPRTTPRLETFIPAGRSGWLRLYSASDIGLLGAVLNYNPTAGTAAGAFNQGRNLHKLTLTSTQTLVIPIFPPNCLD